MTDISDSMTDIAGSLANIFCSILQYRQFWFCDSLSGSMTDISGSMTGMPGCMAGISGFLEALLPVAWLLKYYHLDLLDGKYWSFLVLLDSAHLTQ